MRVPGTSRVAARGRVGPWVERWCQKRRGGRRPKGEARKIERRVVGGDERQKLGGSKEREKKSHIFLSDLV